ncbi:MAG: hypothetical protein JOY59_00860 [Candidatus Eremiobacteraeota bacterium]|nr:hypothetical protein [Candidatus Eremiobacteraeota bacterium]
MQATIVSGVWTWKRWQPDRSMDFNSWFVKEAEGNVAIDPLEPDAEDLAQIEEHGGVAWILITNRDHERATRTFVERFDAQVASSAADANELSVTVAQRLEGGEFRGWQIIELEGFKTNGEIALYSPARRTVILGDALWGDPAGSLRLGAEAKVQDAQRAMQSMRKVLALPDLAHVLVGDGVSLFHCGRQAIADCIERREAKAV